jgi:hypothetical protein
VKDHLRQLIAQLDNDLARGCLVREYLQARVLESLQDESRGVYNRTDLAKLMAKTVAYPETCPFEQARAKCQSPFRGSLSAYRCITGTYLRLGYLSSVCLIPLRLGTR